MHSYHKMIVQSFSTPNLTQIHIHKNILLSSYQKSLFKGISDKKNYDHLHYSVPQPSLY